MASGGAGSQSRSGGGDNSTIFLSQGSYEKPKGLLQAISDIQKQYVLEANTSANSPGIPEEWFTSEARLDFWNVGFKAAVSGGVVAAIFIPLAIAAIEKNIPLFGNWTPTLVDEILSFFLAVSFHIGMGLLLAGLGAYYVGPLTRQMIKRLLEGVAVGALAKAAVVFLFFHFIYLKVITPENLTTVLWKMSAKVSYERLNNVYQWFMAFRPVLLTSAWFVLLTNIVFVAVPYAGIGLTIYRQYRRRKETEFI